jgi:hypothetical protein
MNSDILLSIIELIIGGIVAFLAILLMSKTRTLSWVCMVVAFIMEYAAIILKLLLKIGLFANINITIFGIPLFSLIIVVIPPLFFILSFILMLLKK